MIAETQVRNIRKKILQIGYAYGSTHYGGTLSMAEIMVAIFGIMRKGHDRFILSKGHCSLALYATLAEFGYITSEELATYNKNATLFPTHCIINRASGIELSSGSLGLGLSFAIGEALALDDKGYASKIFVLSGNGELNEGSFWEAAMFAGHKKLHRVTLVLDDNGGQNDGASDAVMPVMNWKDKLVAFNWCAVEVDGHSIQEITSALQTLHPEKPLAIVAKTKKGKGVSFMEADCKTWHHGKMTEEQYLSALAELGG